MVRMVSRRLAVIAATLVGFSLPITVQTSAGAAPSPPPAAPASVTITGDGIETPLQLRAEDDAVLFESVMDQVSWLKGAGHAPAPKPADLGAKFTVVVLAGEVAKQTYDLYPMAKGGPRAFRPAEQPDRRKVTAAWFYGRLNMSETLRSVGVPLPEQRDLVGGTGGGERAASDNAVNASDDLDQLFGDLRQVLLLNAAVIVFITLGLAGISLLVRRRTR
ncbi:hypothetical protein GCM10027290_45660 [Micromonospora sonneratiae]|uniref:Uncharacterized protein n=1 Tax=Micromonospora sonneratiae TaxID=1184706 RepID=A0ABW3YQR3_9ACTN